MAKKINEEIQELIQKIKNEYQEGTDYETVSSREKHQLRYEVLWLNILSLRLKNYCREKFNLPLSNHHHLDFYQSGGTNWFHYSSEREKSDIFLFSEGGEVSRSETENCKQCNQLVAKKEGWIEWWSGRKETGGPRPNNLGYFHPECVKKYFAEKEQPNKSNNSQIKEKLLRNLDKLCLDPNGYLANNEHLKTDGAEEEYQKIFASDNWKKRYLKIVIDGEEIDLEDWDNSCPEYWEVKRELIKKIKSEIKQNPPEWKIEKGKNENYAAESNNRLIKHVSGRRHWKCAISYLWGGDNSERIKHWTEIEALINGSVVPNFNDKDKNNQISDTEKEQIRQYFLKENIKEIRLEKGKLVITHNNNETESSQQTFHNHTVLLDYLQRVKENKITKQSLGIGTDNNTSNSNNSDKNNHQLAMGLALGAGAVILVGTVVYFIQKRKKK